MILHHNSVSFESFYEQQVNKFDAQDKKFFNIKMRIFFMLLVTFCVINFQADAIQLECDFRDE